MGPLTFWPRPPFSLPARRCSATAFLQQARMQGADPSGLHHAILSRLMAVLIYALHVQQCTAAAAVTRLGWY